MEQVLGLKVGWMVPNDFKPALAAVNFGQPVVLGSPRAEISRSIAGFAERFAVAAG